MNSKKKDRRIEEAERSLGVRAEDVPIDHDTLIERLERMEAEFTLVCYRYNARVSSNGIRAEWDAAGALSTVRNAMGEALRHLETAEENRRAMDRRTHTERTKRVSA